MFGDTIQWAFRLLLGSLATVIGFRLITRRINTTGLFCGIRADGSRYFSPERVQLLMVTLAAAARYLSAALSNPHAGSLPDVPNDWLTFLGGSHALYLGRKAFSIHYGSHPLKRKS
ncbi:MAG TPA: hypothetical protein VGF59_03835, partial [Bryobacteraceae bacterium]